MLAVTQCYVRSPKLIFVDEISVGFAPGVVDTVFESLLSAKHAEHHCSSSADSPEP